MQASRTLELEKVRHPRERTVFWLSVLVNVGMVAGASWLVYMTPEWLAHRRAVSALVEELRVAAIATIVLLPALGFLRHGRWAAFRENSIRLGRDQLPEVHSMLERLCAQAGVDLPELYASPSRSVGLSTSMGLVRSRRIIVLGPDLFQGMKTLQDRADVLEFVLAHELGRIVLGHATWWEELLLGYLKRIPFLRVPLLTVQTESRDRFAARLCHDAIRGLVLVAGGGKLVYFADVATFIRQAMRDDTPPLWAWIGTVTGEAPHASRRIRHLYRSGLLDLERDLARAASGIAPAPDASGLAATR